MSSVLSHADVFLPLHPQSVQIWWHQHWLFSCTWSPVEPRTCPHCHLYVEPVFHFSFPHLTKTEVLNLICFCNEVHEAVGYMWQEGPATLVSWSNQGWLTSGCSGLCPGWVWTLPKTEVAQTFWGPASSVKSFLAPGWSFPCCSLYPLPCPFAVTLSRRTLRTRLGWQPGGADAEHRRQYSGPAQYVWKCPILLLLKEGARNLHWWQLLHPLHANHCRLAPAMN